VRHRTVPALAVHRQSELVSTSKNGCSVHTDYSGWDLIPEVRPDNSIGRIFLKKAVVDHGKSTLNDLFGWLENEYQRARKLILYARKYFSGDNCHRDVTIVAAGVHSPISRSELEPGKLVDGQAIDVGSNHKSGAFFGSPQDSDESCFSDACLNFESSGCQTIGNRLAGLVFFESEFRNTVEVTPSFNYFGTTGCDKIRYCVGHRFGQTPVRWLRAIRFVDRRSNFTGWNGSLPPLCHCEEFDDVAIASSGNLGTIAETLGSRGLSAQLHVIATSPQGRLLAMSGMP
jgi:hypothetical protein